MLYKYIGDISDAFVRYVKIAYNGKTCDISSLSLIFLFVTLTFIL